jgi:hypothetical protein
MTRDRLMWIASGVLLVWIGLLTADHQLALHCAGQGGRWETLNLRCVPDPGRILLQREIRRS